MSRGGDDDPLSGERAALDLLIAEMLEQAPDRVVRAIEEVVKQLYNDGRYSPWEIEEAAMQLCRELGIPRTMN